MKKTALAKSAAKKIMGKMTAPAGAEFGKVEAAAVNRREQRKLDQALGLVPFATKLNADLIKQLETTAKERGIEFNAFVAEVLLKGLAAE